MGELLHFPRREEPKPVPMFCSSCGAEHGTLADAATGESWSCECGCTVRQSWPPPEGGSIVDPGGMFQRSE